MSYIIIVLALSWYLGSTVMFLTVISQMREKNPFRVFFGSAAFWAIMVALSYVTVSWPSAIFYVIGGGAALLLQDQWKRYGSSTRNAKVPVYCACAVGAWFTEVCILGFNAVLAMVVLVLIILMTLFSRRMF